MGANVITVIIDDRIRDKQYSQRLNTGRTVGATIEILLSQFGLPIFTLEGSYIQYELIRSKTGESLAHQDTLAQLTMLDGEVLQLVSPQARLLWQLIEQLKDEIRDYLQDKLEEMARKKLEELKETLHKTQAQDPEAQQLETIVEGLNAGGPPLLTLAVVGGLVLVGLVIVIIIVGNRVPPPPDGCRCEGPDLVCEDGTFVPIASECEGESGGEVECFCEGPDLYCEDGSIHPGAPECANGRGLECHCEGPDLVCSDDTVERDSSECVGG